MMTYQVNKTAQVISIRPQAVNQKLHKFRPRRLVQQAQQHLSQIHRTIRLVESPYRHSQRLQPDWLFRDVTVRPLDTRRKSLHKEHRYVLSPSSRHQVSGLVHDNGRQKRYIKQFFTKEGVRLDWEFIEKNPGLRGCQNTTWTLSMSAGKYSTFTFLLLRPTGQVLPITPVLVWLFHKWNLFKFDAIYVIIILLIYILTVLS